MPLFTINEIKSKRVFETASIKEADNKQFDIFLSHSYQDRGLVTNMHQALEEMGYKVYVDWIFDRNLNRSSVDKHTANILRKRMRQAKSLFYLHSENTPVSSWMPWETGFFDALKDKVAILPLVVDGNEMQFAQQEYLGLYPYVSYELRAGKKELVINNMEWAQAMTFSDWLVSPDVRKIIVDMEKIIERLHGK